MTYLPEAKEYNSFDAQKLCQGLVGFQLLGKDMVKNYQRIKGQGYRNVQYN